MTKLIDGKIIAQQLLASVAQQISHSVATGKRPPCLAVILVGDDPASQIYVGRKAKACEAVGMHSRVFRLPASCAERKLTALIDQLNYDSGVDGILLQLPLPAHLAALQVTALLAPHKDVDGLTPENQGLLALNRPNLVPCTPLGIIKMLESMHFPFAGSQTVVIGRSSLVGAPVARLLERCNATVTTIHSHTRDPLTIARRADLLIVAAGKHHLVDHHWVKRGAVVVDVGIHRVGASLQGDVNFDDVAPVAQAITPVPGGVGPMTIACLLTNCMKAYKRKS